jgi:2,4-dienoyl-CoA reductase (NADPH2)
MFSEVHYVKCDDEGFHVKVKGEPMVLNVDHVIICAGQVPCRGQLYEQLKNQNVPVHFIGGSREASELDAKGAIKDALMLAIKISTES